MPKGGATDGRREVVADGLLTVAEACGFLRLSRSELYAVIGRGELVSLKQGRFRFVPRRAAVDYLAAKLAPGPGGTHPAA